ncbi:hypothetical protein [Lutibacter sp.]
MMRKILTLAFLLCFSVLTFAQKNINNYKYILVPTQYEFLNSPDKYQLNSLTKFLFKKAGFTAIFIGSEYPKDLMNDKCLALKAAVNKNSSLFTTKLNVDLIDCNGKKVFSTSDGKSKEKDYKKSYYEALRAAFKDLEALNYTYQPVKSKKHVQPEENAAVEVTVKKEMPMVKKSIQKTTIKKEVSSSSPVQEKPLLKTAKPTVNGTFDMGKWGVCTITATKNGFDVVGGDENFVFATIYNTSVKNMFIIKWKAYKQPFLVKLDNQGNLQVDTATGVETYKRIR